MEVEFFSSCLNLHKMAWLALAIGKECFSSVCFIIAYKLVTFYYITCYLGNTTNSVSCLLPR